MEGDWRRKRKEWTIRETFDNGLFGTEEVKGTAA